MRVGLSSRAEDPSIDLRAIGGVDSMIVRMWKRRRAPNERRFDAPAST
jgi:hypothetical protein